MWKDGSPDVEQLMHAPLHRSSSNMYGLLEPRFWKPLATTISDVIGE
jgi:hypothetical protein